jgi:hypothetical protein
VNLFWLDTDPVLAAQAHQDIHVGKMLLEAVQLLCTAFEEPRSARGGANGVHLGSAWSDCVPAERLAADALPYAHTHRNHPCALWVRASRGNFDAAISLAQALAAEFRYRFDKPHASETALDWVVRHRAEAQVPDGPLTPYAWAMPEKYALGNLCRSIPECAVAAYRAYYRNEKRGHWRASPHSEQRTWIPAKWTRRQPPEWF